MEINALGNKQNLEQLEKLLKDAGLETNGVVKSGVILSPLYTLRMRLKRGQKFDTSENSLHKHVVINSVCQKCQSSEIVWWNDNDCICDECGHLQTDL